MEASLVEFKKLLDIMKRLMGPSGCPWDQVQTLVSVKGSILEEAYEVLEALEAENYPHLAEELGDLFYNILFFCALGEKEGRFTLVEVMQRIGAKLIERHPHVFGEGTQLKTADAVLSQWETIKDKNRESVMDGIPKALPALTKAYKMIGRMKHKGYHVKDKSILDFENETDLGETLFSLCTIAKEKGVNPEHALNSTLFQHEKEFRHWEKEESK